MMIIPFSKNKFYIVLPGEKIEKAMICYDQEQTEYDDESNIISRIKFLKVNNFENDYDALIEVAKETDFLYLSRDNMPSAIYSGDEMNEKTLLKWQ